MWELPPRSLKVRAATAILARRRLAVRTLVRSRIWPGQTRSTAQPQRTFTRSARPETDTPEIVSGGNVRSVGVAVPTVIAST